MLKIHDFRIIFLHCSFSTVWRMKQQRTSKIK